MTDMRMGKNTVKQKKLGIGKKEERERGGGAGERWPDKFISMHKRALCEAALGQTFFFYFFLHLIKMAFVIFLLQEWLVVM